MITNNMVKDWMKVLVTVGSTQFNQLVHQVISDSILTVLSDRGCRELTIQLGSTHCPTIPDNTYDIDIKTYEYKDSILEDIKSADLVIGHAGAGTALEVLREHKPLIIVINSSLMANHQKEMAETLQTDGYLRYCYVNTLADSLTTFDTQLLKPFPEPNPSLFSTFIDDIFFPKKLK